MSYINECIQYADLIKWITIITVLYGVEFVLNFILFVNELGMDQKEITFIKEMGYLICLIKSKHF